MQSTNKDKGVDQHKCIFGSFTAECLDTGADDLNVQTQRLIRNRDRHKFTKKKKNQAIRMQFTCNLRGVSGINSPEISCVNLRGEDKEIYQDLDY